MTTGEKVIAFIERYCRVPDGKLVGQPIKLEPFQKKFITRRLRQPARNAAWPILSIARKNGKSALIAALVLAHLVGPVARQNAQLVSGAQSRDQAALFSISRGKMIQLSPELSKIVRVVPSGKRLLGLSMNTEFRAWRRKEKPPTA
jgi:phage terminase large subunit-like protein